MLIRLLCVYRMTKYVCKILLRNSKRLLRKLQKILGGYFFAAPCRLEQNHTIIYSTPCIINSMNLEIFFKKVKRICMGIEPWPLASSPSTALTAEPTHSKNAINSHLIVTVHSYVKCFRVLEVDCYAVTLFFRHSRPSQLLLNMHILLELEPWGYGPGCRSQSIN